MPFWNLSRITSANFNVSGLVQQPLPDFHPRQSRTGGVPQGVPERGDVLTRQFLLPPNVPVQATKIDALTTCVKKKLVRTAFLLFQINWELPRGTLAPIPLLEVTWAVEWMLSLKFGAPFDIGRRI